MARVASTSVERVREATNMVELVGERTDLRRQGARWTGLCPFHDERTPSFSVNADDKLYYCFGCEAKGDLFTFVQETQGVGFTEAVEYLADRYGVELEREQEDPEAASRRERRERLEELLTRASSFFSHYLWESDKSDKIRRYLSERGLGEVVLREFGVGYSPPDWGALLGRAQMAGFSTEELEAAGLARKGRRGHYDAFRARIVFPVRDRRGRVVGFGARATRDEQRPKYVNSAETELYKKNETLYGIDLARAPIAKAGEAVLVEGYTDVIALHQAGIRESVGIMGTAITDRQVATLAGLASRMILCLDSDSAGQEAMLRAQRVARGRSIELRVVTLPGGQDPADFLGGSGDAAPFRELLDSAVTVERFQVDLILSEVEPGSAESRDRALARVAPVLAPIPEGALRDELIKRSAEALGLDPPLIIRRIAQAEKAAAQGAAGSGAGSSTDQGRGGGAPARTVTPRERHERALLSMCIEEPKVGEEILSRLTPEHMSGPLAWRAVEWLRDHLESPLEGLPREDQDLTGLIQVLVMQSTPPESSSLGSGYEPASPEAMEVNFLLLEQRRIDDAIARAREAGDSERQADLIRKRGELLNQIATVGS